MAELLKYPREIVFKNVEEGKTYERTFTIQNLAGYSRKIRCRPIPNNLFLVKQTPFSLIASGLNLTVTVTYNCRSTRVVKDRLIVTSPVDANRVEIIEISIVAIPVQPAIEFPSFLDFGTTLLHSTPVVEFEVKNNSKQSGELSINNDPLSGLSFEPLHVKLPPQSSRMVKVSFNPTDLGVFRSYVPVSIGGSVSDLGIDIAADVTDQNICLLDSNDNMLEFINIGTVFEGEALMKKVKFVNNGPIPIQYQNSFVNLGKDDLDSFEIFEINNYEGIIDPHSHLIFNITIHPKLTVPDSHTQLLNCGFKLSYKPKDKQDDIIQQRLVNDILIPIDGKVIKPNIICSSNYFKFNPIKVHEKVEQIFTIRNENPDISLEYAFLDAKSHPSIENISSDILKVPRNLPQIYFKPMVGKLDPLQEKQVVVGFSPNNLLPKQLVNVLLVGFARKRAIFSSKLSFELSTSGVDHDSTKKRLDFIKQGVNRTHKDFIAQEIPQHPTIDEQLELSIKQAETIMNTTPKLALDLYAKELTSVMDQQKQPVSTFRRKYYHERNPEEFDFSSPRTQKMVTMLEKRRDDRKKYDDVVRNAWKNKKKSKQFDDNEVQLGFDNFAMMKEPKVETMPMESKLQLLSEQEKLEQFRAKKAYLLDNVNDVVDKCWPESSNDNGVLNQISKPLNVGDNRILHTNLNLSFGRVVIGQKLAKSFNFLNIGTEHVAIELSYSHVREILNEVNGHPVQTRQIVPPNEMAFFALHFCSNDLGPLSRKVMVKYNGQPAFDIVITAEVVSIEIQHSPSSIEFNFDNLPSQLKEYSQTLVFTNMTSSETTIKWLNMEGIDKEEQNQKVIPVLPAPSTDNGILSDIFYEMRTGGSSGYRYFYASISGINSVGEAVLSPYGSIEVKVSFRPGIPSTYSEVLFFSIAGNTVEVPVSASLSRSIVHPMCNTLDIGVVGVGIKHHANIVLRNQGENRPFFLIDTRFLPPFLKIDSFYGTLEPGEVKEIPIDFLTEQSISIDGRKAVSQYRRQTVSSQISFNDLVHLNTCLVDDLLPPQDSKMLQKMFNIMERLFSSAVRIYVFGLTVPKFFDLPIIAEGLSPKIKASCEQIIFNSVKMGSTSTKYVNLINESSMQAVLFVDFGDQSEFSVLPLPDQFDDDEHIWDGSEIQENNSRISSVSRENVDDLDSFRSLNKVGKQLNKDPFAYYDIAEIPDFSLSEEEEEELNSFDKVRLYIPANGSITFCLRYFAKSLSKHRFLLPVSFPGFGNDVLDVPEIIADTKPTNIILNKCEVIFGSKVFLKQNLRTPLYEESIILTNSGSEELEIGTYIFDKNNNRQLMNVPEFGHIQIDNIPSFLVSVDSIVIPSKSSAKLTFSFYPLDVKNYQQKVYIGLKDDLKENMSEIHLQGFGLAPFLRFNPIQLNLPPIPLGVELSTVFTIENIGFENDEVVCVLPNDKTHFPFKIEFLGSQLLNASNSIVPVKLSLRSDRPLSFSVLFSFNITSKNISFPFRITGACDNSILTIESFVRHFGPQTDSFEIIKDKIGIPKVLAPQGFIIGQSSKSFKKLEDLLKTFPRSFDQVSSAIGNPTLSTIQPQLPVFSETLENHNDLADCLVKFLGSVSNQTLNSTDFPQLFYGGKVLASLTEDLIGGNIPDMSRTFLQSSHPPIASKHGDPLVAETEWLCSQINCILTSLKSYGCLLNHVKPEYLLTPKQFIFVSLKEFFESLPKNFYVSKSFKKSIESYYIDAAPILTKCSWLIVLLQIAKIFGIQTLKPNLIKKQMIDSVKGLHNNEALINYISQPLYQSNIMSIQEISLLKWINVHLKMFKLNNPGTIDGYPLVTNFSTSLIDCVAISAVIHHYIPALRNKLSSIFINYRDLKELDQEYSFEQCKENINIVLQALEHVGISKFTTADVLLLQSNRIMLLFVYILFQLIPLYSLSSTIEFSAGINETCTKVIEVSNPSTLTVNYRQEFLYNIHQNFKLMDPNTNKSVGRIITLKPKSSLTLDLQFKSKFSTNGKDTLAFYPVSTEGNHHAAPLIFDLYYKTKKPIPSFYIKKNVQLYEKQSHEINLEADVLKALDLFGSTINVDKESSFDADIRSSQFNISTSQVFLSFQLFEKLEKIRQSKRFNLGTENKFLSTYFKDNSVSDNLSVEEIEKIEQILENEKCFDRSGNLNIPMNIEEKDVFFIQTLLPVIQLRSRNILLVKNEDVTFPVILCPLFFGCYFVDILFHSTAYGEFSVRLEIQTSYPSVSQLFSKTFEGQKIHNERLDIPYHNVLLENALIDNPLANKVFSKIFSEKEPRFFNYGAYWNSNYFKSPSMMHIFQPNGIERDLEMKFRRSLPLKVQENIKGKNGLDVSFTATEAGTYRSTLVLLSNFDIRLYSFEYYRKQHGVIATIEFTSSAFQSITQSIPITNSSSIDWLLNVKLDDGPFSCKHELKLKAKTTANLDLEFRPLWLGTFNSTVQLINQQTNETFTYNLIGIGLAPEPIGTVTFEAEVRIPRERELKIENPFRQSVVVQLETDSDAITGEPTLRLNSGMNTYPIIITAKSEGRSVCQLRFTTEDKRYFVYNVIIMAKSGKAIESIPIQCTIRQATEVVLSLHNPLPKPLMFNVRSEGLGLFCPNSITLDSKTDCEFVVTYSPLVVGKSTGKVIFSNDAMGEFYYDFSMAALPCEPINIPLMTSTIGRCVFVESSIYNPCDEEVILDINREEAMNFFVIPVNSNIDGNTFIGIPSQDHLTNIIVSPFTELKFFLIYQPSDVNVVQPGIIRFNSSIIGEFVYHLEGIAHPPQPFDPIELETEFDDRQLHEIPFRNPFAYPVLAKISIDANPYLNIITPSKTQKLSSFGTLIVSVSTYSKEMKSHNLTICVETSIVESPDQITRWELPIVLQTIKSYNLAKDSFNFDVVARTRNKKVIQPQLEHFFFWNAESEQEISPTFKRVNIKLLTNVDPQTSVEHARLINTSMNIKPVEVGIYPDKDPQLTILFEPLKSFSGKAKLLMERIQGGGRWYYNFNFNVNHCKIDDTILIGGELGTLSKVQFTLFNVFDREDEFKAYFTPESPLEFEISPSQGLIASPNDPFGTCFVVSFTPKTYGRRLTGTLIIETKDMEWRYKVISQLPDYEIPHVESRIGSRQSVPTPSRNSRNFVSENIRSTSHSMYRSGKT
eukprot:TRINITY_DN3277_c0_g1_i1.p1 TRINITY_DN3277_c0_g1~~TRINITY_DN3277_c0_g1_i1.p1  ORF type:complete len:3152 (+),score=886.38 TRINITY_DN3277_c0_g1_i1:53-9508(+)